MLDSLSFQSARRLQDAGRFDEARKTYRQILARNPNHFESHAQLALMDFAQGRPLDALKENARALKLRPDLAGLHNNHGTFQLALGRFKDAAGSFTQAVRLDPRDAQARNNLGGALSKLGRLGEALANIDAALAIAPGYAKAHSDRAMVLNRFGRPAEAAASAEQAIGLRPELAEAHNHRGVALLHQGRLQEALAALDSAIAADPALAVAHNNRGAVLDFLKRDDEALSSFRRALELDPEVEFAPGAAIQIRMRHCDWDGIEDEAREILKRIEGGALASTPFIVLSLGSTPAQQKKAASLYTAAISPSRSPHRLPSSPSGKIRVGYFSPDFSDHPVAHAVAGVFERHDRTRFEISAFLLAPRPADPAQQRIRAAVDRFVDVSGASDEAAAELARAARLDLAVDLAGYTTDARPGLFTRGVAPVQVSWLGYPGTLVNEALAYLIADAAVIPDECRANYAEKIVTLPNCFFPTDDRRLIPPSPSRIEAGLPETGFVFASFNSAPKITRPVFDIWMRLLAEVSGSILWLAVRNEAAQNNLRAQARARGIDPGRIYFAPSVERASHLARQRLADLFLDTYPYGAHSTAADALQAGLPVLTMPGAAFTNRVASSLLASLGMNELIAGDWADYESKALGFARDREHLAQIRARLAANLKTAPTFDTGRFTRNLESAYAALVERAAAGAPAAGLVVPDCTT